MKGSITFEKNRKAYCVWWYVPEQRRSVPIRYYYGIKLYSRELAEKLLALIQGTYEKSQRGECLFRIENFIKGSSIDVVELFESWLETKKKLKPGGLSTYKSHFSTWIRPFFLTHQIALHEITLDVLHKLKRSLEDKDKKPKMVKNVMDTMRAFMTYAWRNGNIVTIPPFPLKSEYGLGQKDIRTVPRDVQFEIIRFIPAIHRPIFYWLALHPGRRPGEAMAIYKEDYNRFKNCFIIKRTISNRKLVEFPKNYKCHEAACHESFEPFLEELMQTDGPFLFTNPLSRREGKRYTDSTLNKLWAKACQACDIQISLYNGLKHSTLDYYYNDLNVPLTDLMDLTGHKNLDCIKHYARMKIRRQRSLMALEKDAPYLRLIEGGKKVDSHKIVTKPKINDSILK
jgi:integrase